MSKKDPRVPSEHPLNPGRIGRYEIYPPKLDSPKLVSPSDPYLKPPDPHTTRQPWSRPFPVPVYGDNKKGTGDNQNRQLPQGNPVQVTPWGPVPTRDPEPFDRGPREANDFRPPIIIPGETWRSRDK